MEDTDHPVQIIGMNSDHSLVWQIVRRGGTVWTDDAGRDTLEWRLVSKPVASSQAQGPNSYAEQAMQAELHGVDLARPLFEGTLSSSICS
jgi:hypothetical protein